jgi:hypothetical protein
MDLPQVPGNQIHHMVNGARAERPALGVAALCVQPLQDQRPDLSQAAHNPTAPIDN